MHIRLFLLTLLCLSGGNLWAQHNSTEEYVYDYKDNARDSLYQQLLERLPRPQQHELMQLHYQQRQWRINAIGGSMVTLVLAGGGATLYHNPSKQQEGFMSKVNNRGQLGTALFVVGGLAGAGTIYSLVKMFVAKHRFEERKRFYIKENGLGYRF